MSLSTHHYHFILLLLVVIIINKSSEVHSTKVIHHHHNNHNGKENDNDDEQNEIKNNNNKVIQKIAPKYISKEYNTIVNSNEEEEYDDFYESNDDNYNIEEEEDEPTFAMFVGKCMKNEEFKFPLSSGSGIGIIAYSVSNNINNVTINDEDDIILSTIDISTSSSSSFGMDEISHLFPEYDSNNINNDNNLFGLQFDYADIDSNGALMKVNCNEDDVNVFSLYRDNDDNVMVPKTMTALSSSTTNQYYSNIIPTNNNNDNKSQIETRKFRHGKDGGIKYYTKIIDDTDNNDISSSYLNLSPFSSSSQQSISIKSIAINDNKDVIVTFDDISTMLNNDNNHDNDNDDSYYKLKARIGMKILNNNNEQEQEIIPIVDVEAIVNDGTLIVHSGWIRRKLEELNLFYNDSTTGNTDWEVIVIKAIATDINKHHVELGRFSEMSINYDNIFLSSYSSNNNNNNNNNIVSSTLSQIPLSNEELNISNEMLYGRKPNNDNNNNKRRLGGGGNNKNNDNIHKKILIHGYCSTSSPFNIKDFNDAIEFQDPINYKEDNNKPNWSHDTFAKKIQQFAVNNDIKGCSCIAHSQGGAACLHLKTYYWSCLDEASKGDGKRVMQSVGTPYKGTKLAGVLAMISNAFRNGCGKNYDLTYKGAKQWLSNIPKDMQKEMYYYTSTYNDYNFKLDYCNAFTSLFLAKPNDGVTEVVNGQLPYGVNCGNVIGYCHNDNMRDPHQCWFSKQNEELDRNAMY